MTPFEGVGLRHGDESEQTRSLALPPAPPVFAVMMSCQGVGENFSIEILQELFDVVNQCGEMN